MQASAQNGTSSATAPSCKELCSLDLYFHFDMNELASDNAGEENAIIVFLDTTSIIDDDITRNKRIMECIGIDMLFSEWSTSRVCLYY